MAILAECKCRCSAEKGPTRESEKSQAGPKLSRAFTPLSCLPAAQLP